MPAVKSPAGVPLNKNTNKRTGNVPSAPAEINTNTAPLSKYADIKDFICPFKIDLKDLNQIKFLTNIPRFARSFFVSTLPRNLIFGEFLRPLYKFGNLNTSIHINPINEGLAQSNLSSIINDFESERVESVKQDDQEKENIVYQKIAEASILRDEIAAHYNKLFEVSILSTLFAFSQEDLDALCELLGAEMAKTLVNLKSAWSYQNTTFKSNLPFNNNQVDKNNTFDTYGISTIFPFISTDISHPTGIPIGINKKSGYPILLDAFSSSFTNYNLILFGKSSSGKRVTIQLLTLRSYLLEGIKTAAIDADGRYSKLASTMDGITISLGADTKVIINPFDIEIEDTKDDITGKERTILNLESKIEDVTGILMTMARGSIRSQYPNDVTREIIRQMVAEEYKELGITNSPDSLYGSQGANLVGTRIVRDKKPMPTIGSWYNRLCEKAKNDTNPNYKYHYDYLIKYMKDFLSEHKGRISYYDGQTNIDMELDSPFTNFDLSKLDDNFQKPLAQQVLLSWLCEKYAKTNSEDKHKYEKRRIIVDEAWLLLPYAEAVDFLGKSSQLCTRKNTSLTIVSQNFGEFYKNGKLNNMLLSANVKLFMRQDDTEVNYLADLFRLTEGENDFLDSCLKGEGILQIDTNCAQLYVAPTSSEAEMIEFNAVNFELLGGDSKK